MVDESSGSFLEALLDDERDELYEESHPSTCTPPYDSSIAQDDKKQQQRPKPNDEQPKPTEQQKTGSAKSSRLITYNPPPRQPEPPPRQPEPPPRLVETQVAPSPPVDKQGVKYYIVKSINESNIKASTDNGVWATQKHNEDKFNHAFRTHEKVILIFSVNQSGHFQGYARMITLVGQLRRAIAWEGNASVGNQFGVQWEVRCDLPFSETEHLRNPLNENKPVKVSRDGQELPSEVGQQLINLFEEFARKTGTGRPPQYTGPASGPIGPHNTIMGKPMTVGGSRPGLSPQSGQFPGPIPPGGNWDPQMHGLDPSMSRGPMDGFKPPMGGVYPPRPLGGPAAARMPVMRPPFGMDMNMSAMNRMPGVRPPMGPGPMGMRPAVALMPVPPPQPPPPAPPPRPRPPDYPPPRESAGARQPRHSRSHSRSPSRSRSPRRGRTRGRRRSRDRSHSWSRSHSRSRSRERPNILTMSYDEYLKFFRKVQRRIKELTAEKEEVKPPPRPPPPKPPGNGIVPAPPPRDLPGMGGMMGAPGMMGIGPGGRGGPMTEEEYVQHCQVYFSRMGAPCPPPEQIRMYYRQMAQMWQQQQQQQQYVGRWGGMMMGHDMY